MNFDMSVVSSHLTVAVKSNFGVTTLWSEYRGSLAGLGSAHWFGFCMEELNLTNYFHILVFFGCAMR